MNFLFNNFDSIFNGMLIFHAIFFIFVLCFILYIFSVIFSKKGRSRFVGKQLDMQRQILKDNKDVIQDIKEMGGEINIQSERNIMEENEEALRYTSSLKADIEADAIRKKAKAFKEGFGDVNLGGTSTYTKPQKYCKYCGEKIDADSVYCNKCGEKQ